MHLIGRPALNAFKKRHPLAINWLDNWWHVAMQADWRNLEDVRGVYQNVDQVGRCLVFNVLGNNYRLICGVKYARANAQGILFLREFLTHAEYNQNKWKKHC